jgi:lipid-binding SYLF domain-containing protein
MRANARPTRTFIGAQSIDLVLLVMNERGTQKMRNKVTLGAEASIAAKWSA